MRFGLRLEAHHGICDVWRGDKIVAQVVKVYVSRYDDPLRGLHPVWIAVDGIGGVTGERIGTTYKTRKAALEAVELVKG